MSTAVVAVEKAQGQTDEKKHLLEHTLEIALSILVVLK
jgi:hypothetical protein